MAADNCDKICSLASLILHESKLDITSENLSKVIKAAGADVPSYWVNLFCKVAANLDFEDLMKKSITGGGSCGGAAATGASTAAGADSSAGAAAEAKKEEPEEEEDEDMGFSLFD